MAFCLTKECVSRLLLAIWLTRFATTDRAPLNVNIGLLLNASEQQEMRSIQLAVQHVNSNNSMLPNTSIQVLHGELSKDGILQYAVNLSRSDVIVLLMDSLPTATHETLSNMLLIPLVATDPRPSSQPTNYGLTLGLSPSAFADAAKGIIGHYKWKNVMVIYDVRQRHRAQEFACHLPSKVKVTKLSLELDHKCSNGELCDETKQKLSGFNNAPVEAFVLFVDFKWVEAIINQVHCSCSFKIEKPHNWLLADTLLKSRLVVQSSQIVIGFTLHEANNPITERLALELPSANIKKSSLLLYDAVWTIAHALDKIISSGKWKNDTQGNLKRSSNGETLLESLKEVKLIGTTDVIQFNRTGNRINTRLDILNLRNNQFVTVGQWSPQDKLKIANAPLQNRESSGIIPLDKLNRRLRVVVVKDAPFVMVNKDGELEGFSIDLIKEIAEMLSFRYEIYLSHDGLYGGWNDKTGYTGIVGEIMNGRADLSTSPLTINSERLQVLDFSKPFMQFTMSLISKKMDTSDHDLTTFMLPYSTTVWLLTLACLLFVTILMYLVNFLSPYGHRLRHKRYGETGEEFDFFNSLWFCLASMLQQGADHTPKSFSGRVLAGCFWFCILIWISTYTANLAAFFTVRNSERQINTLEDVVDGDHPFYIMRDSALHQFFRVAEYHTYRKLWERMSAADTFANSTEEGYSTARNIPNAVFMAEKPSTEYVIMQKPCDLRTVNGLLGAGSYGIAMSKHTPYIRNMSVAVLRLQETSVLDTLWRKWWEYKSQCPKGKSGAAVGDSKRIQLESMVGVYLVLAGGGCVSLVLVMVELWWRKYGESIKITLRTKYSFMREKTSTISVQPTTIRVKTERKDASESVAC